MTTQDEETLREKAIKRIKKKRDFAAHAVTFVVVNAFIVFIWAVVAGGGFFWPMFPILGWGIGLFFHWWDIYHGEITEEDIEREMQHLGHAR
jgi:fatty acid desaturase